MCFLNIIASCIVPFKRMDAGIVWKELVILFSMRVVKLLVVCSTAMSLPPGVYVRMGNLIEKILGHSIVTLLQIRV